METKKIINLLSGSNNEESKFATQKWYITDNQTAKDKYNPNNSIKFETETTKSSLFYYSDAFILVTGNIIVNPDNDTYVVFKNCAPLSACKTEINDMFIDKANHIYNVMPMYNLTEYSDNYSDTSGSLWQFKNDDLTADNSESFKYKTALVRKTADHTGTAANNNLKRFLKNTKILVPLKYLSYFWRSLDAINQL